jgi:hypothetical protein
MDDLGYCQIAVLERVHFFVNVGNQTCLGKGLPADRTFPNWSCAMESRRRFLRRAVFCATGIGIVLVTSAWAKLSNAGAPLLKVKVVRNLMARYVNTVEEYNLLDGPASLGDLLISYRTSASRSMVRRFTSKWLASGPPSILRGR